MQALIASPRLASPRLLRITSLVVVASFQALRGAAMPDPCDVIAISAGSIHSLAVRGDGIVLSWGSEIYGELGDGKSTSEGSYTPRQIELFPGIIASAVAAGFHEQGGAHSLALDSTDSVWAWGYNLHGQLGDGTSLPLGAERSTPYEIGLTNVTAISAGGEWSMAIKTVAGKGVVYTWGANQFGQLGDGTTTDSSTPTAVAFPSPVPDIKAIAAGEDHGLALTATDDVYAWGRNDSGQVGDGSANLIVFPPAKVFSGATAIAAGDEHSLALTASSGAFAWGSDALGQLGSSAVITGGSASTPVPIDNSGTFSAIAAGQFHSLALDGGKVWSWGRGDEGQLGDGTFAPSPPPTPTPVIQDTPKNTNFAAAAIAGGEAHSLAIVADGSVWAWGNNGWGQVGIPLPTPPGWGPTPVPTPVMVPNTGPTATPTPGPQGNVLHAGRGHGYFLGGRCSSATPFTDFDNLCLAWPTAPADTGLWRVLDAAVKTDIPSGLVAETPTELRAYFKLNLFQGKDSTTFFVQLRGLSPCDPYEEGP